VFEHKRTAEVDRYIEPEPHPSNHAPFVVQTVPKELQRLIAIFSPELFGVKA
jgi:hypothetical protein